MNNDFDSDEELDLLPPVLRRQNATAAAEYSDQRFFDTASSKLTHGNPDLAHWSNRGLIKVPSWRNGQCGQKSFFHFGREDDNEPDMRFPLLHTV